MNNDDQLPGAVGGCFSQLKLCDDFCALLVQTTMHVHYFVSTILSSILLCFRLIIYIITLNSHCDLLWAILLMHLQFY